MSIEQVDTYGDELPAGAQLCGGQYTIERYLNAGGFGITYLARDSLNRQVVIKECFPGAMCCRTSGTVRLRAAGNEDEFTEIIRLFEKEARALAELRHPYIVGVHQIFLDNGTAYMAMDYVPGKNLLEIIETEPDRLSPEDVRQLLIKCLDAVGYIHEHDILHRDISPDNILIDADNNPVLIDFGAARESATRVSRVLSKVLTVKDGYSPQEFYLQGSTQSYSSDLYALAATFYHLVSREAPPSSHLRMAAAARKGPDPLQLLANDIEGYDSYFLEAVNDCLSIFPKDRLPSAAIWRDIVDLERRRDILLSAAEDDQHLEEKVCRLVAEQRKALAQDEAAELVRQKEEAIAKERAAEEAKAKLEAAERARLEAEAAERAEEEEAAAEAARVKAEAEAAERAARAEALAEAGIVVDEAADGAAPAMTTKQEGSAAEAGAIRRMLSGRRRLLPGFSRARGQ